MSVFGDTQVQGAASAATPMQGVGDDALSVGLGMVGKVADAASSIGSAMKKDQGDVALADLTSKLGNIAQAYQQDPSKATALRAQANKLMNGYFASGGDANKGRQAFNAVLGSGGGGSKGAGLAGDYSLFQATPAEQARAEKTNRMEVLKTYGYSTEDAERTANAEFRMKTMKQFQPQNEQEMAGKHGNLLADSSIQFTMNLDQLMQQNPNGLNPELTRTVNMNIEQQRQLMLADLAKDATNGNVTPAFVTAQEDRINKRFDDMAEMINDKTAMSILQEATQLGDLQIKETVQKHFRGIKVMEQAGGQVAVTAFLEGLKHPEGSVLRQYFHDNPYIQQLMAAGTEGLTDASLSTFEKGLKSDGQRINMFEADMLAKSMAGDKSTVMTTTYLQQADTNPTAQDALNKAATADPQALEKVFTQDTVKRLVANAGSRGFKAVTNGMKTAALQSFLSETGELPKGYINIRTDNRGRFYANFEGSSQAAVNNIKSLYRTIQSNPAYLKELSEKAGQELTLEQAVNFELGIDLPPEVDMEGTGEKPKSAARSAQRKRDKGPSTEELLKTGGASITVDEQFSGLMDSVSVLIRDEEFMGKSSEEKLKELENMGYDGSLIRAAVGNLFGGGPDKE